MSNAASTPEFKRILQDLYDSGRFHTSGDVLKEAWRVYRERHGQSGSVQQRRYAMRKTLWNPTSRGTKRCIVCGTKIGLIRDKRGRIVCQAHLPKENPTKFRHEKLRSSKNLHHIRTVSVNSHRVIVGCPVSTHGKGRCPTAVLAASILHPKSERRNPIAVYNPSRSANIIYGQRVQKLPAKNIEIRYQRVSGRYARKWFRHKFKSTAVLLGMSDGSILLKSIGGKRLWGTV